MAKLTVDVAPLGSVKVSVMKLFAAVPSCGVTEYCTPPTVTWVVAGTTPMYLRKL